MNRKIKTVTLITAAVILLFVITAAVIIVSDKDKMELSEDTGSILSQESVYIPPISEDIYHKDREDDRAEVELDIGKIERDTDPDLIDTKIEYGSKEGKENE